MEHLISLDNVSKFYTSASNVVVGLNRIQLSFHRGEFVAITGESGSGKTTLSNVMGGMLGYEGGEMFFAGRPTSHYDSGDWERYRRDNISFISQNYGILPGATVLANVLTALRLAGMEQQQAREQARQILEQVELWHLRSRRAAKLSSGQKQRLSIARALAKPAPILIADEPTGNLDPENSAKVISLLATAAQSRLVLIVTHEFEEVQDYVTRHIRLQDGNLVTDAQLRPAPRVEAMPRRMEKNRRQMGGYVAWLQLKSRPVWSVLMTLFFTLTAFAVVAFLGAFIIALDDTDTRIYDSSAFLNGDPRRIVVSSRNFQPLGQGDYEKLANMEHAVSVERNGYVSDVQYSYRDGVDYTTIRTEQITGSWDNPIHTIKVTYQPHKSAPYVQTVPVLPQGQTFLKEGRLPEQFYEVVAHRKDGLPIGQQVKVFLTNRRYWGYNSYLELTFTVVGITDYGKGLYFDDDMGRFCQHVVHTSVGNQYYQFLPAPEPDYDKYAHLPSLPEQFSYDLLDGQCCVHSSVSVSMSDQIGRDGVLKLKVPNINFKRDGLDPTGWENLVELSTPPVIEYGYPDPEDPEGEKERWETLCSYPPHNTPMFTRLIYVNQNTFDQLCWDQPSEQVSLTITDYAYTDRVLKALDEMGYVGASPFQLGSTKVDEEKAAQREQTLTVCLLALLAVVALQVVMLRAMFGVQTDSYLLLRNIGLVSKGAKKSILLQFALFTLLGQLLGGGGIYLCNRLGVQRIVDIVKYLPPAYLVILSAVHIAAAFVAAVWVQHLLTKQVYPLANRFSDLAMDEEVAE